MHHSTNFTSFLNVFFEKKLSNQFVIRYKIDFQICKAALKYFVNTLSTPHNLRIISPDFINFMHTH